MVRNITRFIFVFILLNLHPQIIRSQVTDAEISRISERIESVEKVDQLYTIRFNVGKYANRKDLTLKQQAELTSAMRSLSDAFKMRSHFRNAADVYKEYLDYNHAYLARYNAFVKDSLLSVHKKIADQEEARIASLDTQIAALKQRREAVSGLKQKYYTLGGIAAVITVVLSIIIGLSKTRSIKQAESHISSNREKLLHFNRQAAEAGMIKGGISYCHATASSNIEIIEGIIDTVSRQEDRNLFQNEIKALQKAVTSFGNLKS